MIYATINDVGKQWIRKYTLALAKEMLGYIRGKYSTLPIPNSEITLNGADLISGSCNRKRCVNIRIKRNIRYIIKTSTIRTKTSRSRCSASTND